MKEFKAYLEPADVAHKLNAALSLRGSDILTAQDVIDWQGDESGAAGANYNKTDIAVQRYMGPEMYQAIDATARMIGVLHARLQGFDAVMIGGMKFQNLQDGLWP